MRKPNDPPKDEGARTLSRSKAREDRLKAALKANMARRKAQAKARTAGTAVSGETDTTG